MRHHTRARRLAYMIPLVIAGAALFITIGGLVVRALWNWLLPPLFALPAITFWQAVGLLALSRILFGGLGRGGGGRWRRWERMSPEERQKFRCDMRARFARPNRETNHGESGGREQAAPR